ncbi:hypothetical protein OPV22_007569 [Ensete ventricosum]|uniref:F-box domain-containing protein n=1 Tax=Ensete ventricosum TaxID=4639 RepID=A0AAV8RUN0_ENSVE|nr:hypothetical protein OPV22_007569 [Ensete ventricosum]
MQDDDHGGRREEVKEETAEWGRHYEGMTRHKVVHRILLRLPAKSLLRFRCVSRRWNGIISSNSFVHAHAAAPRLVSGLLYQSSQGTLVYSQFCYATASLPDPSLSFLPEPVVVKASARGLLCCRGRFSMMYYVCNPSTAVWVSLPQPGNLHNYRTEVVLMIDDLPRSNRFTEFRVVCAFPEVGIPHHVYGLETFSTDEWRWATSKWSPRLGGLLPGSGVVVGGRACWRTTMDTVFMYDPRDEERLGFERPKKDLDGVTWWEIGVIDGQLSVAVEGEQPEAAEDGRGRGVAAVGWAGAHPGPRHGRPGDKAPRGRRAVHLQRRVRALHSHSTACQEGDQKPTCRRFYFQPRAALNGKKAYTGW